MAYDFFSPWQYSPWAVEGAPSEDEAIPDKLCELCQRIFDKDAPWSPQVHPAGQGGKEAHDMIEPEKCLRHHTVASMTSSASAGCHLCTLISSRLGPRNVSVQSKVKCQESVLDGLSCASSSTVIGEAGSLNLLAYFFAAFHPIPTFILYFLVPGDDGCLWVILPIMVTMVEGKIMLTTYVQLLSDI